MIAIADLPSYEFPLSEIGLPEEKDIFQKINSYVYDFFASICSVVVETWRWVVDLLFTGGSLETEATSIAGSSTQQVITGVFTQTVIQDEPSPPASQSSENESPHGTEIQDEPLPPSHLLDEPLPLLPLLDEPLTPLLGETLLPPPFLDGSPPPLLDDEPLLPPPPLLAGSPPPLPPLLAGPLPPPLPPLFLAGPLPLPPHNKVVQEEAQSASSSVSSTSASQKRPEFNSVLSQINNNAFSLTHVSPRPKRVSFQCASLPEDAIESADEATSSSPVLEDAIESADEATSSSDDPDWGDDVEGATVTVYKKQRKGTIGRNNIRELLSEMQTTSAGSGSLSSVPIQDNDKNEKEPINSYQFDSPESSDDENSASSEVEYSDEDAGEFSESDLATVPLKGLTMRGFGKLMSMHGKGNRKSVVMTRSAVQDIFNNAGSDSTAVQDIFNNDGSDSNV